MHSASRDKFAQNVSAAYTENNDSVQLDHEKKKPNLSSIIMVKQKSGLKTDRVLQSEPVLEKKSMQSNYKEYFKQKCFQPYLKKKASDTFRSTDGHSESKLFPIDRSEYPLPKSPMKRMQLQLPANESGKATSATPAGTDSQRTPKKQPEYKSPKPYKYLNQKMF